MTALYGNDWDDPPEESIVKVWLCKIRKKVRPLGIEINTNWGVGCHMPEESKAKARELMAEK
jgi:two-component system cell cycle response regulator CtrA